MFGFWSQIMNTEIEQLQNVHTHTQARLADYRRKLTELAHCLLKVRETQHIKNVFDANMCSDNDSTRDLQEEWLFHSST